MSGTTLSTLPPDLLAAVNQEISGRIVTSADADWDAERHGWNLCVDQRPLAVVHAAGVADVAALVRFARRHGLAVATQPVGHSASTAVDGTFLLRTTGMRRLSVDTSGRTARVDAGVRSRDLNAALSGTGLTSLPGSSGDPTVVGYTLGGGLSWFGRKYGLAANHVRAFEMVDPDGAHVRVTERSDPDLFWALRGGGGEFGVVTALEVDLLPAPHIYGGRLAWAGDQTGEVLEAFTQVAYAAPDELTAWAWLFNLPDVPFVPEPLRGRWSAAVDLTFLGQADEAKEHLEPLRRVPGPGPIVDTLGPVALAHIGDIAAEPDDPIPARHDTTLLTGFDEQAAAALTEAIGLGDPDGLPVTHLRGLGGALARPVAGHGAVGYVDEPFMLMCSAMVTPELAGPIEKLVERVGAAMAPYSSGKAFANFAESAEQAYRPEVLARLSAMKSERDPRGVIRSNRPLPPVAKP